MEIRYIANKSGTRELSSQAKYIRYGDRLFSDSIPTPLPAGFIFSTLVVLCSSFACSLTSIESALKSMELEGPPPEGVLNPVEGPARWVDEPVLVDAEPEGFAGDGDGLASAFSKVGRWVLVVPETCDRYTAAPKTFFPRTTICLVSGSVCDRTRSDVVLSGVAAILCTYRVL